MWRPDFISLILKKDKQALFKAEEMIPNGLRRERVVLGKMAFGSFVHVRPG
jgi:hypothetical protein